MTPLGKSAPIQKFKASWKTAIFPKLHGVVCQLLISICLVLLASFSASSAFGAASDADSPVWSSLPTLAQIESQLESASTQTLFSVQNIASQEEGFPYPDAEENGSQKDCEPGDEVPFSHSPCVYGDLTSKKIIAVVGDSEADMWIPTFDIYGKEFGFKIDRIVMDGCTPWKDQAPASISGWANCERKWKAYCVSEVLKLRPYAVVASGMLVDSQSTEVSENPAKVASDIDDYFTAIRRSKSKLFVLSNIPWNFSLSTSPSSCVDVHNTQINECDPKIDSTMKSALSIVGKAGIATVIPVTPLFCGDESCPVVDGNIILYSDNHHFSHSWATYIPLAFSQIFNPLLGIS